MKLTQAEYDALSDSNKKLFRKVGDGYEAIPQDQDPNADLPDDHPVKKALKKERDEVARLKREQKEKDEAAQTAKDEEARKTGSVADLEKSWAKKLADRETELNGTISKKDAAIHKLLVDGTAASMATRLGKSPGAQRLLKLDILQRLKVEEDAEGNPMTRVLDKDGKISALTLEDYEKEILADKGLADMLTGSRASGGGAGTGGAGAGGFSLKDYQQEDGSVNWSKVNIDRATNPDIVSQVQEALTPTQQAGA